MQIEGSPFTKLLPVKETPHIPDGSFGWLVKTPVHDEWAIGDEKADELLSQLDSIITSADEHGLSLPDQFTGFIRNVELHKHLRSANGDYLDLAGSILPALEGYLVRFLSDQQGGAFWYIYMSQDGSDYCVVSSYEYFDADGMDYEPDELASDDFTYFAPSLEAFFCRYWIEHEMMFHRNDGPPPDVDAKFLELYGE